MNQFLIYLLRQSIKLWYFKATASIVIILIGVVMHFIFDADKVIDSLNLTPFSERDKTWSSPKFSKYMHVYLFNWKNHVEYERNSNVIPIFSEVGPFVFRQDVNVTILGWDHKLDSLSFERKNIWKFDASSSISDLSTNITNVNALALMAAYAFRYETRPLIKMIINYKLSEVEQLFVTKTVQQILFDGYMDRSIKSLTDMKLGIYLPNPPFAWFYGKNNSYYEGVFEIQTKKRILTRWNGTNRTPFYDPKCSLVTGGINDLVSSFPDQKTIRLFKTEICRALSYTLVAKEVSEMEIENLNKYVGEMLNDKFLDEETECSCRGECVPPGALNASTCWKDLPVFISYPHFWKSDFSYTSKIAGMFPDSKNHQSYIFIEKVSGLPVKSSQTYQINLLLQSYQWDRFKNVSRTFVPILWYKEFWEVDSSKLQEIKTVVGTFMSTTAIKKFGIFLWALGLMIFLMSCLMIHIKRKYQSDPEVSFLVM